MILERSISEPGSFFPNDLFSLPSAKSGRVKLNLHDKIKMGEAHFNGVMEQHTNIQLLTFSEKSKNDFPRDEMISLFFTILPKINISGYMLLYNLKMNAAMANILLNRNLI